MRPALVLSSLAAYAAAASVPRIKSMPEQNGFTQTQTEDNLVVRDGLAPSPTLVKEGAPSPAPSVSLDAMLKDPRGSLIKGYFTKFITPFLPAMKIYKTESMPPTYQAEKVVHTRFWYGPFVLNTAVEQQKWMNPLRMDPQSNLFYNRVDGFPTDISILSTAVTLVNADGSLAAINNGVYNHHINFADANKLPDFLTSCPNSNPSGLFGQAFLAGVAEDAGSYTFTTPDGKLDSGYYVGKDHNVFLSSEIVNYTNDTKSIYAVIDMEYIPGKSKMEASFETLSVTQCDSPELAIPLSPGKKQFTMVSKELVLQYGGYIIGARGHLHDGGTGVVLTINGKAICDSKAEYSTKGAENGDWATISSMGICEEAIPVKKGDVLTVSADYNLDTHPAREHVGGGMTEGMGLAIFGFVRTD